METGSKEADKVSSLGDPERVPGHGPQTSEHSCFCCFGVDRHPAETMLYLKAS